MAPGVRRHPLVGLVLAGWLAALGARGRVLVAGRLDVFVRGRDDQLWHRAFDGDYRTTDPAFWPLLVRVNG